MFIVEHRIPLFRTKEWVTSGVTTTIRVGRYPPWPCRISPCATPSHVRMDTGCRTVMGYLFSFHRPARSSGSYVTSSRERKMSISFGRYPEVSLAEARSKRDEAKKPLAQGTDPADQRRLNRIAAETAARQIFGLVASEYIQQMEANDASASTTTKTLWLLEDLAAPLPNARLRISCPPKSSIS